jgi:hypothetical protein
LLVKGICGASSIVQKMLHDVNVSLADINQLHEDYELVVIELFLSIWNASGLIVVASNCIVGWLQGGSLWFHPYSHQRLQTRENAMGKRISYV